MRSVNRRRPWRRGIQRPKSLATLGLPHRVRRALVRLGGIGRIRAVGVPFSRLAAVWAAAPIMITPAATSHLLHTAHPSPSFHVGAILIGGIGVPAWPESAISPFAGMVAMLRAELRLRSHDDAVVMLGVLEKALRRDHVAGRESIAGERHILLGDMRRRPPDFPAGPVRVGVPPPG